MNMISRMYTVIKITESLSWQSVIKIIVNKFSRNCQMQTNKFKWL